MRYPEPIERTIAQARGALGALGLSACLLAAPGLAQEPGPSPIDADLARAALEQVRAIVAADDGELWGLPLDFPILFVDPASRAAVADRQDARGLLSEWEGLWAGQLPPDLGVANTTVDWAGVRWTMLVWPLPEEPVARARLLIHESFHNAQPELGISASSEPCAHLATLEGRLWLRLEARALAAALTAEPESDARGRAAVDSILFRTRRQSLFPGSTAAEDALERLEGSAEYTGMRLCSPDPAVRIAATVAGLEGLAARPSLARSFQYATGPALGLLLDDYDPWWRGEFLEGRELSDLLEQAVGYGGAKDLKGRAAERAKEYGWDEVLAAETALEAERQARFDRHRARFRDGPVLILPARSPRRSFDPSRIDLVEGLGSVYGTLWISDDWGVADAPGGALLLADMRVHLAAPSDVEGPELAGDGWTLELKPGWNVVAGEREGDWRVVPGGK